MYILPTYIDTDGVSIQMGPSVLNITFAAARDPTLTLSAAPPSHNGSFSSERSKGDAFLFLVVAVRRRTWRIRLSRIKVRHVSIPSFMEWWCRGMLVTRVTNVHVL
jgi:hypothetical protein